MFQLKGIEYRDLLKHGYQAFILQSKGYWAQKGIIGLAESRPKLSKRMLDALRWRDNIFLDVICQ